MSLFWKLVDETQISKSLEATRHHNSTKLLILLPQEPFSFIHFNMIHLVIMKSTFCQKVTVHEHQKSPSKAICKSQGVVLNETCSAPNCTVLCILKIVIDRTTVWQKESRYYRKDTDVLGSRVQQLPCRWCVKSSLFSMTWCQIGSSQG